MSEACDHCAADETSCVHKGGCYYETRSSESARPMTDILCFVVRASERLQLIEEVLEYDQGSTPQLPQS